MLDLISSFEYEERLVNKCRTLRLLTSTSQTDNGTQECSALHAVSHEQFGTSNDDIICN